MDGINMSRRGVLGGMAVAPMVGKAMASNVAQGMAESAGSGVALGYGGYTGGPPMVRFTKFADWLLDRGEREMRDQARQLHAIDPDIMDRRLPNTTKLRLQRERNYQRILADRRDWFDRCIRERGFIEMFKPE